MAIRYIDIKQEVLSANDGLANKLRVRLKEHKTSTLCPPQELEKQHFYWTQSKG